MPGSRGPRFIAPAFSTTPRSCRRWPSHCCFATSSCRCAYRAVVAGCECPSCSPICARLSPCCETATDSRSYADRHRRAARPRAPPPSGCRPTMRQRAGVQMRALLAAPIARKHVSAIARTAASVFRSFTAGGDRWMVFAPVFESGRCSAAPARSTCAHCSVAISCRPAAGEQQQLDRRDAGCTVPCPRGPQRLARAGHISAASR